MNQYVYGSMSNSQKIEFAVRTILESIGEDPNREGLKETPERIASMFLNEIFAEVTTSKESLIKRISKTFSEEGEETSERFGDMVIVRDIPFYSTCEHHLVPFFGKAHIGYIPREKVIGLSKIARLVEAISKKPQLQERITKEVAEYMMQILNPLGVCVVIEAEHLCMGMRGVKKPGSTTVTSAAHGVFKDDQATRLEFLELIRKR